MDIFQMASKISALSECFFTLWASKRSLACMLSEVVSEIAAFLKD